MLNDLKPLAIFAETVTLGSFRKAAEKLSLSPSVVSYHVSLLEERLGCTLLHRTTRSLSLTSEGKELFEHAAQMLQQAEEGLAKIGQSLESPAGNLSITMPTALTKGPWLVKIAAFQQKHPGIKLHINYTDQRENLVKEGIDIAIRAGELPNSSLKSIRLPDLQRALVCSPSFYEKFGPIKKPDDLLTLDWIKHSRVPAKRIFSKGGRIKTIVFKSTIEVNSLDAMVELTRAGLGLSTPPRNLIEHDIKNGNLVEVLTKWTVEAVPLHAIWPDTIASQSAVRRLLDHLTHQ